MMAKEKRERVMGEYAKYAGERVKIGTCEDMYYLRDDQAKGGAA